MKAEERSNPTMMGKQVFRSPGQLLNNTQSNANNGKSTKYYDNTNEFNGLAEENVYSKIKTMEFKAKKGLPGK